MDMDTLIKNANILLEALPYIQVLSGKTIVIKYGGNAMLEDQVTRTIMQDITLLKYVGMNPIVVHGGGPAINGMLKRLNIASRFTAGGLRVTDEATMEVVEMMLSGQVNKDIVNLMNQAGGEAVGLSGKDGKMLSARKVDTEDGEDIGLVGQITSVDTKVIRAVCAAGMIPVIAPVATDREGGTWNVNADTAAGDIAAALEAEKLVFLTDTPGLLRDKDDPDSLIHRLHSRDVETLKKQGVISGGMAPKVDACLRALDAGVRRNHIIDGRTPHSMLLEIFTDKGLGTLVSHDVAAGNGE